MKTDKINGKFVFLDKQDKPGREILLQVIDESQKTHNVSPERVQNGMYIGYLKRISDGQLIVEIPDVQPGIDIQASAACSIDESDIGKKVALSFTVNNNQKPLVLGVIKNPGQSALCHELQQSPARQPEKLVFDAQNEITLQCGKASLTLTRGGKIIIKGEYISSRSTGMHRIKGGAVHIN